MAIIIRYIRRWTWNIPDKIDLYYSCYLYTCMWNPMVIPYRLNYIHMCFLWIFFRDIGLHRIRMGLLRQSLIRERQLIYQFGIVDRLITISSWVHLATTLINSQCNICIYIYIYIVIKLQAKLIVNIWDLFLTTTPLSVRCKFSTPSWIICAYWFPALLIISIKVITFGWKPKLVYNLTLPLTEIN